MSPLASHKRAFAVFLIASVLWGFATPVGVSHMRSWGVLGGDGVTYEVDGRKVDLVGEIVYEAHGFGMPEGFVRFGSYAFGALEPPAVARRAAPGTYPGYPPFSADYTVWRAQGYRPVADTPELRKQIWEVIRARGGDAESEPTGFFVKWDELAPSSWNAFVHFSIACWWWVAVRRWTWKSARSRARNALGLVGLAVVPCLVCSWTVGVHWVALRQLLPPTPALVPRGSWSTERSSSCVLCSLSCSVARSGSAASRRRPEPGSERSRSAATLPFFSRCLPFFPNPGSSFPNPGLAFPRRALAFPRRPGALPRRPGDFPRRPGSFPRRLAAFPAPDAKP